MSVSLGSVRPAMPMAMVMPETLTCQRHLHVSVSDVSSRLNKADCRGNHRDVVTSIDSAAKSKNSDGPMTHVDTLHRFITKSIEEIYFEKNEPNLPDFLHTKKNLNQNSETRLLQALKVKLRTYTPPA